MKFTCKDLSVDDEEIGCTVSFSDQEDNHDFYRDLSTKEIMKIINSSTEQYILLQKTYREDDFEKDYYYIEISDSDKSGELKHCTIDLYRNMVLLYYKKEMFEISININIIEFERLKKGLEKICRGNANILLKSTDDLF